MIWKRRLRKRRFGSAKPLLEAPFSELPSSRFELEAPKPPSSLALRASSFWRFQRRKMRFQEDALPGRYASRFRSAKRYASSCEEARTKRCASTVRSADPEFDYIKDQNVERVALIIANPLGEELFFFFFFTPPSVFISHGHLQHDLLCRLKKRKSLS